MCETQGIVSPTFVVAVLTLVLLPAMTQGAGQAVGIKHPVLPHGINPDNAAGYEQAVARVMAMSDDEMLSFVPDSPVVRFCYCPNCHGGSQGSGIFTWSIDAPDQITCKYCGMVFPNDKYPCDQTIEGENALGEKFTYRYHKDKVRDDLREFIPGHIRMHRRGWIMNQAKALAVAYHATGNEEYARRAILILDRVAQTYPHYPAMRQWITTFTFMKRQTPPYDTSAGGKWGRWLSSELPAGVPATYDLLYDSPEFDKLSKIRGYDVREKFENDFLKATWEYTQSFGDIHTHNMAPFYLRVAARIGKVINEPDYVHWSYKWLMEILIGGCYYDGMWHEAPSYHYQVMGGLRTSFAELKGYSDPPGYVNEETGKRFDDLDPDKDIAFFVRAKDAPALVAWPNGIGSAIHDTWAMSKTAPTRNQTTSTILPGYGHASLGRGISANQMQAQLHFSGCHGHSHYDALNLTLFAKEREMLCDIGYTHTKLRNFSVSTIGHNLVAVDRTWQTCKNADGDLIAYFPNLNGVSAVEADGKRAYANIEGLDTYRRLLVLIPVSDEDAYVADIFRVRGGNTHDWLLHGSANHDMTAACNIELTGKRENLLEENEEWVEPRTEGSSYNSYGVIRDVAGGSTDGDLLTTFTYVDEPEKGARVHLLAGGDTEVFLGRSPSIRKAGRDSKTAWDFWMPQLVLRRRGQAPLASTFVAIEEPYSGRPFIRRVERVQLNPADDNALAIRVWHGDTVDTIISTLDEPPYAPRSTPPGTLHVSGVIMKGRLGIVRQRNGKTVGAWLFDGMLLTTKDWSQKADRDPYTGAIAGMTRKADGADHDAFITAADLPIGDALHGVWMIVTHGDGHTHGYEIDRVEERDGKRRIILTDDHGLRMEDNNMVQVFYPRGQIEGTNTFYIPLAVTMTKTDR